MAMVLGKLHGIPHDLMNIVASFMPPIAKIWSRSVQERIIRIVPVILHPIPRDDEDQIQEVQ